MMPLILALLLAAAPPADRAVDAALASAGPGTRVGLVVVDEAGEEVIAVRADDRFVPASNTKIFTTAAAFATLDVAAADGGGGASVRLEGRDVVLAGHGDARLSGAAGCTVDCLAELARAVAAKTRVVGDVIGDDTEFPDERWPAGMSWNNQVGQYGTAISALSIDDNVVVLTVTARGIGERPAIAGDTYYKVDNQVVTVPGGKAAIVATRTPGSDLLRVTGTIPSAGAPETLRVGVDDPAHRAAWLLAAMLRANGVQVTGRLAVRHRPLAPGDDPETRGAAPVPRPARAPVLARLVPPPLAEDLLHTNKVSQNLHAELLLRRVGAVRGSGSVADGRAAVTAMLDGAQVARWTYDLADGSGMSNYNRITPRGTVAFLRWTQSQPWGAAWRATLPVGGIDGTLARRFKGTPLDGKLFAKTGTLNAANALSGFLVTAKGRTFTFSALANDMPGDASATGAVDKALLAVAAAN
ncbi:MAG TPA: D-alanyl-D-alanine carboxypeptidase/D-alanyl-D-alanine-endopeptidase [Sphingomonas sp.]|nr:D-alanyl-D-alanine carboxypeptidase/D-alanyl-D-alanine-endopeptidase [Sphingomonas sp.]